MKISYNLTGADRKKLVTAIATELSATAKYLGAPSFAYQIGEWQLNKNGTLTGKDNLSLISDVQERYDLVPVDEEYDVPMAMITLVPEEKSEPEEFALTIEVPKNDFTDTALENLKRLIVSKSSLIKKAIGIDNLDIEITDDRISFPWFNSQGNADRVRAYTLFVTALCDMAKTQKRITSTAKETYNDKYAFRCFLLRLGFIGSEFKVCRKILLKNLDGNGAFKAKQETTEINREAVTDDE